MYMSYLRSSKDIRSAVGHGPRLVRGLFYVAVFPFAERSDGLQICLEFCV